MVNLGFEIFLSVFILAKKTILSGELFSTFDFDLEIYHPIFFSWEAQVTPSFQIKMRQNSVSKPYNLFQQTDNLLG